MFNIAKHCIGNDDLDKNDYIIVCRYVTWSNPPAIPVGQLIIDMDIVSGALTLKNTQGTVIYIASKLYENWRALQEFFLLAESNDGLIKFHAKWTNNIEIDVYLYKPLFTKPLYIPWTFEIRPLALPSLGANEARNEYINEDYNCMFKQELHNYQQNNVAWMIGREELVTVDSNSIEYLQLGELGLIRAVYDNEELFYNRNTKFLFPNSYEENIPTLIHQLRGGILADEVGLGKTFSMFGLIMNTLDRQVGFWNRKPTKRMLAEESEKWTKISGPLVDNRRITKFQSNATLIICPSRLAGQWTDELKKFMIPLHDLRVYTITTITLYRKLTPAELCNADIVIISDRFLVNNNYFKYVNDRQNQNACGIHDFYWKRLIIDEGHEILAWDYHSISPAIRDQIYGIKSRYRWLCTGTPFPHVYESLDHYLYFLSNGEYKLKDYAHFDADTVNNFLRNNTRRNTYEGVKTQIYIPPIVCTTVLLTQDPIERALYVNATGHTTRMIQLCTNILVSDVDSSIIDDNLTSLDDIRQRMCDYYQSEIDSCIRRIGIAEAECGRAETAHENAADQYEINSPEYRDYCRAQTTTIRNWKKKIAELQENMKSMESRKKLFDDIECRAKKDPCVICYGEMTDIVLTKCSHIFCRGCMQQVIDTNPHNVICPMCRTQLNRSTDIGYIIETPTVDTTLDYYKHVQKWGTKMAWMVQYLYHIMEEPTNRVIIFSQWKRMLQLVGDILKECDIKHVYLRGSAIQLARNIRRFKSSDDIRTIMLSSETCSSGSNLTEASHIVLLDTVNGTASQAKAIEDQAIGRAARLGQNKQVQVVRLIMENTIEYDYYKDNINQTGITEIKGGEGVTI